MDTGVIGDVFRRAGCRGWLCALDIDGPGEVTHEADAVVVAASVFKVMVAFEFLRQAASGRLDPRERVRLAPADRTPGPTGFSTFADEVEVSLRDLSRMMLVVSDNAATDAVLTRVGLAEVNQTAASLGLTHTTIETHLGALVDSIGQDAGFAGWEALQAATGPGAPAEVVDESRRRLLTARALIPELTTRTTAREMAALLRLVWRDEAGPDQACAQVRHLMAAQLIRNRLATGFPPGVMGAAKSGSLLGVVRNEIGVVGYPDGGRYAVAVFTRGDQPFTNEREINNAIGAAAAQAVDGLRNGPPG